MKKILTLVLFLLSFSISAVTVTEDLGSFLHAADIYQVSCTPIEVNGEIVKSNLIQVEISDDAAHANPVGVQAVVYTGIRSADTFDYTEDGVASYASQTRMRITNITDGIFTVRVTKGGMLSSVPLYQNSSNGTEGYTLSVNCTGTNQAGQTVITNSSYFLLQDL